VREVKRMKRILATMFAATALALIGASTAHADTCYTDCYQNGDTYQCTQNCY
jgi:hypothetical protein